MVKNGQTYYLLKDQVGTIKAVVTAAGVVEKEITYDSFGNILEETNPTFTIPLGFAGGLHDRNTALVRFGFRDYDPDSGTWTAKDPVLFASGDIYLYEYCSGNPVKSRDPLGLWQVTLDVGWGPVGRFTVYQSDNQVGFAIGVGVGAGANISYDRHTSDNLAVGDGWTFDYGAYASGQAAVAGIDSAWVVSMRPDGAWSSTGTGVATVGLGIVGRGEVEGCFWGSGGMIKHAFGGGIDLGQSHTKGLSRAGVFGGAGWQFGTTISNGTVQRWFGTVQRFFGTAFGHPLARYGII